jgi:hypothetical protein
MALNVAKPFINICDSNGLPLVGAKLFIYQTGTTTLTSVYTDESLETAATNPATSDAAGNFPRLYIAAGTYKLRTETSAGVLIWEYDDIDTGLSAGTGALPIARGGTGATTASAARVNLDVPSNSELTALSTSITSLSNTIQNIVSAPQGRLTPTSGAVVATSDVTAAAALYYTPAVGNLVPIYDGTQFNAKQFSELTLTLVAANHLASTIYDVYVALDPDDGSTVIVATGPAWATSTAGSGARGTGAASAEIEQTNGIWTNANDITVRNGSTTYDITANQGTYIGTILVSATAGKIDCHVTGGQSRSFGVWNAYNRKRIVLTVFDSTSTWNYSSTTIHVSNSAEENSLITLCGLSEEWIECEFRQIVGLAAAQSGGGGSIGIGVNSTTVMSGTKGKTILLTNAGIELAVQATLVAAHSVPPAIGANKISALEASNLTTSAAFAGTEASMRLSAVWEG